VIYDNLICSEQNSSYFSNNHDLKIRCCCKKFNVNIGGKDQKCSDICDKTKYSDVFISFPCKETKKLLHQEYLCQLGMNDASKYDVVCGSHFLDDDFEFVGRRYQLKKKTTSLRNNSMQTRLFHNASIDIQGSVRPCPPFPFKYVNFRTDSEVNKMYLLLVDKTLELKENLKKKALNYLSRCFSCRDETKEDTVECTQCHKVVCKSCMDNFTDDSIWIDTKTILERTVNDLQFEEEEEEYEYLCNVCYSKDDSENNNNT